MPPESFGLLKQACLSAAITENIIDSLVKSGCIIKRLVCLGNP